MTEIIHDSRLPLLLFGAGGHAKSVLGVLADTAGWSVRGLLDDRREMTGRKVMDLPVLGTADALPELLQSGTLHIFAAIGDNTAREDCARRLAAMGFVFPMIVHPTALVMARARIGAGCLVHAFSITGPEAIIGEQTIIGAQAAIGHESIIGAAVHIGAGSLLGGNAQVGDGAFLGMRTVVVPGVKIGRHARIAAGSVVSRDLPDGAVAAGSPARVVSRRASSDDLP